MEVRHATPRDKRQPPADLSAVPRGQAFYIASINNWVAKKRQELDLLLSIAKSASTASRSDLVFILAGPQTTQIRKQAPQLYAELQSMPNLYIIEGNIEFKQLVDAGICDAIVKTYSDLSLSLSLFQACSLGLAIIAEQESYMGAFVLENKVGISVEKNSIQIQEIMDRISQIRSSEKIYTEFFKKYSWENGARILASPAKQKPSPITSQ